MSTIFYVIFSLTLLLDVLHTKRMTADAVRPLRRDKFFTFLSGFTGSVMLASYMSASTTQGLTAPIVGLAAITVAVWVLTTYKRLERY